MKIKTNKVSLKCLLKTATKTLVLRKLQRRKLALSKNINPKNYKTISDKSCFNAFAVSNNELIEVTKNEEINEKVTFGNNHQKNQSGVKRRPHDAIAENYIRSQNIKTVPGNKKYVGMTKYGKKICSADESH